MNPKRTLPVLAGLTALAACPIGQTLTGDTPVIDIVSGGTQNLALNGGAGLAGHIYLMLGSASGTAPGLPAGAFNLPLNLDGYFLQTLQNPNTPPLVNSFGILDGTGQATAAVVVPAGIPTLAGLKLHHAYATISPLTGKISGTSNAEPLCLQTNVTPFFTISKTVANGGETLTLQAHAGFDFGNDPDDLCVIGMPVGGQQEWVPFEPIAAMGNTAVIEVLCPPPGYDNLPMEIAVATGDGGPVSGYYDNPLLQFEGEGWSWTNTPDTQMAKAPVAFEIGQPCPPPPPPPAGAPPCEGTPDKTIPGKLIDGKWTFDFTETFPCETSLRILPRFHARDLTGSGCTETVCDADSKCVRLDDDAIIGNFGCGTPYTPIVVASLLCPAIEGIISEKCHSADLDCSFVPITGGWRLEFEYSGTNPCPMTGGHVWIQVFYP